MPGAGNISRSQWQPLELIRNQWWASVASIKNQCPLLAPPMRTIVSQCRFPSVQCPLMKFIAPFTSTEYQWRWWRLLSGTGNHWSSKFSLNTNTGQCYPLVVDVVHRTHRMTLWLSGWVRHPQTVITSDLSWFSFTHNDYHWTHHLPLVTNNDYHWRFHWKLVEMPSMCADLHPFPLNIGGNHTEVQWNSL